MVASRIIGPSSEASGNINIPEFTQQAKLGLLLFDDNCASCHGKNATGGQSGPPLNRDIYNPGHHGDGSFQRAAKRGVPRHHWNFGDMPPQPKITESQMTSIIFYVRELQMANGTFFREHKM